MGKTRLDIDERRRRTMRAARSVFAEHGFAGARSAAIAKRAGISEAMVWKIFGDKQGLYRAILEEQMADEGEGMFPQELVASDDDVAVFTAVGRGMLDAVRRDPCFYRLLYYSALESEGLSDGFVELRMQRMVDFLADYIARRRRQGAFRKLRPRESALAFMGMIGQYLQLREIFGMQRYQDLDGERYVDNAVELMLGGLRAAAGERSKGRRPQRSLRRQRSAAR